MAAFFHIGLSDERAAEIGASAWPNWIGVPALDVERPLVAVASQTTGRLSAYHDDGTLTAATLMADPVWVDDALTQMRSAMAAAITANQVFLAAPVAGFDELATQVSALSTQMVEILRLYLGQPG